MRFPENIAFGSESIIEFSTTVITSKNGSEQRNINWKSNKMKFNILSGVKSKDDLNIIASFFRHTKGRAYSFRFKDWSDFEAKNQLLGWGDGEKTEFSLIKEYVVDGIVIYRTITKPILSTLKIYFNENKVENFEFKDSKVVFDQPVENNVKITADFEFDVQVRFDSDLLEITMESINLGQVKNVMLIECN